MGVIVLKRFSQSIFLLISLAISIVVTIISWVISKSDVSSLALGVTIIILGTVLDILTRLNEQEERIADLFNLHKELQKDTWLQQVIARAVGNYHLIKNWSSTLMTNRARNIIEDLTESMHDLARGYFFLRYEEEVQIEREMLLSVKQTFKAAAFVTDPAVYRWWYTETASKYLDTHLQVIKSGIKVDRIFMVPNAERLFELKDLIIRQINIGITVWVVWTEAVPPHCREDFIVADDSAYIVAHPIEGRSKYALYSLDPIRVKEYIDKFNQIKFEAKLAAEINWPQDQQNLNKDLGVWLGISPFKGPIN